MIVNDRSNCILNDTGILTVSSVLPNQGRTDDTVFLARAFEIECDKFDYDSAVNDDIEKFDQHLCSYIASTIESTLIKNIQKCHKKECFQCIEVFYENEPASNDFVTKKSQNTTNTVKIPCLSTVHY